MPTKSTAPARSRSGRPPHGRATLTLTINGDRYAVRPVRGDDPEFFAAWRLRKLGGQAAHVVSLTADGPRCECGDWTWRRSGTGLPCKHIAACLAVGLLPST